MKEKLVSPRDSHNSNVFELDFGSFNIYVKISKPSSQIVFEIKDSSALSEKLVSFESGPVSSIGFGPLRATLKKNTETMPRVEAVKPDDFKNLESKTQELTTLNHEFENLSSELDGLENSIARTKVQIEQKNSLLEPKASLEPNVTEAFLDSLEDVFEEMSFLLGAGQASIRNAFLKYKDNRSLSDERLARLIGFVFQKTQAEDIAFFSKGFPALLDEVPEGLTDSANHLILGRLTQAQTEAENKRLKLEESQQERRRQIEDLRVKLKSSDKQVAELKKQLQEIGSAAKKTRRNIDAKLTKLLRSHGIFPKDDPAKAVRDMLSMYWTSEELDGLVERNLFNSIAINPRSMALARNLLYLQLNDNSSRRCPSCSKKDCGCLIQEQFRFFVENQLGTDYGSFLQNLENHNEAFPFLALKTRDVVRVISRHYKEKELFGRMLSGLVAPDLHRTETYINQFAKPFSAETRNNIDSMWRHHLLKMNEPEAGRAWLTDRLFLLGALEFKTVEDFVSGQLSFFTLENEDQEALKSMCETAKQLSE